MRSRFSSVLLLQSTGHWHRCRGGIDGGKTWVDATPSLQARTTITGLPVGSTVQVRFRAIIKGGPDNRSQPPQHRRQVTA